MFALKIPILLVVLDVAAAQYNKQAPPFTARLYLPVTTPTTERDSAAEEFKNREKTTQKPADAAAEDFKNRKKTTPRPIQEQDDDHWGGMPFDFSYAVKEDNYRNDYSHKAHSNGDVVRGEYRVLLPDGRTQVVKYNADWKNGYQAVISYI